MLKNAVHVFDELSVNVYDFEVEGDKLPLHNHGVADAHITIVARGSFKFLGDGWEMICKAGDIVNWDAGKRHEFVALEPDSRCVNIPKRQPPSA